VLATFRFDVAFTDVPPVLLVIVVEPVELWLPLLLFSLLPPLLLLLEVPEEAPPLLSVVVGHSCGLPVGLPESCGFPVGWLKSCGLPVQPASDPCGLALLPGILVLLGPLLLLLLLPPLPSLLAWARLNEKICAVEPSTSTAAIPAMMIEATFFCEKCLFIDRTGAILAISIAKNYTI